MNNNHPHEVEGSNVGNTVFFQDIILKGRLAQFYPTGFQRVQSMNMTEIFTIQAYTVSTENHSYRSFPDNYVLYDSFVLCSCRACNSRIGLTAEM